MARTWLWTAMLAMGCAGDDGTGATDGAPVDDTDGPTAPAPFTGAPLAPISGTCPDASDDTLTTFESGADTYSVLIKQPSSGGQGKPVLYFFHGLGGSASLFDSWLDFQDAADVLDMTVVAPDSLDPDQNTWTLEEGRDMVMFDDLRSCLAADLDINLNRVYVTGFSFGGLFTTALTMDRADTMAASIPMSGGTNPLWFPYRSPDSDVPVLVMWGGPTDTFGSGIAEVRFEEMAYDFSDNLVSDGHLVHHCDHGLGHDVPAEWLDIVAEFTGSHTYGAPGPVDAGAYPPWCSAP